MKIKYLKLFVVLLLLFCLNSFSEINYRVSGRVVYNGKGINDIKIYVGFKTITTKSDGGFYLYLPNGDYYLTISNQKGYIRNQKQIKIKNKNIKNVVFFLNKGGSVSGTVKYKDGTPVIGRIGVTNKSSTIMGGAKRVNRINVNGTYLVSGIPENDDVIIYAITSGTHIKEIHNLSVLEGEELKNVDFIFSNKKISLTVKIIDKLTKGLLEFSKNLSIGAVSINIFPNLIAVGGIVSNNGEFVFYNLPDGKYNISVNSLYYKSRLYKIFVNNENENKYLLVELEKK